VLTTRKRNEKFFLDNNVLSNYKIIICLKFLVYKYLELGGDFLVNLLSFRYAEKIMTNKTDNMHSSSHLTDWHDVDWKNVNKEVTKLRYQIFASCKIGDFKKAKNFQKLMLKSKSNLLQSIRRITSINTGKITPGIDNMIALEPKQKLELFNVMGELNFKEWNPHPVRRIYIPKPDGRQRPIGIPTIKDRILQAIVKNALEPEWESKFEDCSYGFRPSRSVDDAINRIFVALVKQKRLWIVDADIKGCFDSIGHNYLMEQLSHFPAKELVRKWLKAGIMENQNFIESTGTPQGSIVSPLLCNIALHGLEKELGVKKSSHNYVIGPRLLVRYADDFLILCTSYDEAKRTLIQVGSALKIRELELAQNKTRIVHLKDGFDFLGYTIQLVSSYGTRPEKLFIHKGILDNSVNDYHIVDPNKAQILIKPSKKSVENFKSNIKEIFTKNRQTKPSNLIKTLNPVLRGWAISKFGIVIIRFMI
jgi:RNA-directed DNA polymerase